MSSCHLSILLVAGAGLGQGDDYYASVADAARELSRQLDYLQQTFVSIPGPPMGRGLYKQSDKIIYDLIYFRQQVKKKVAREELYIVYDKMDGKLETFLSDVDDLEKWTPALRMVAKQVISANHDLQFALSGGDGAPARKGQAAYRQTLVLANKTETLLNLVRYVFDEQESLPQWNAGFKELQQHITALQKLQKTKKPSADDLKAQFEKTDQAWEKLVAKFKDQTEDLQLMLRLRFGQVDQVFARLAPMFGVKNRRPPLKAEFA